MGKITISNLENLTLESNDSERSVLSVLQENYIDWMHACGAKGRCTTCKMIVTEGLNNLSAPNDAEIRFENMGKIKLEKERLSCQAKLIGDSVIIKVPDTSKLPHMKYSN